MIRKTITYIHNKVSWCFEISVSDKRYTLTSSIPIICNEIYYQIPIIRKCLLGIISHSNVSIKLKCILKIHQHIRCAIFIHQTEPILHSAFVSRKEMKFKLVDKFSAQLLLGKKPTLPYQSFSHTTFCCILTTHEK